ncbi:hypothetical protein CGZ80_18510 [Rhodopirellula sp. MGV]|nr:hypothetical protein CGZ80_18510 [Rhodopirellula sp. MGV]PNY37964.1 hypothetical protein C2E31_05550 [Rhodopirellula baltica]
MFNNIHYDEGLLQVVDLVKDPAGGSVFQFSICIVHFAICNPPVWFAGRRALKLIRRLCKSSEAGMVRDV